MEQSTLLPDTSALSVDVRPSWYFESFLGRLWIPKVAVSRCPLWYFESSLWCLSMTESRKERIPLSSCYCLRVEHCLFGHTKETFRKQEEEMRLITAPAHCMKNLLSLSSLPFCHEKAFLWPSPVLPQLSLKEPVRWFWQQWT